MIVCLTTVSDMGAQRLDQLVRWHLMDKMADIAMGSVKDRTTLTSCMEARVHLEIKDRPGLTFDLFRDWVMQAIRYTYDGPGMVILVERLSDNASLEPEDREDDPILQDLLTNCKKGTQ